MGIYSKLSKKKIEDGVTAGKDFKLSSMRGESGWNSALGYLPENWQVVYKANREDKENPITFTIFSYGTPIAWRLEDGTWIVPPVKYSVTTTGHQSAVTYALSSNGWKQLGKLSWWER
jgi:hypothetical protein